MAKLFTRSRVVPSEVKEAYFLYDRIISNARKRIAALHADSVGAKAAAGQVRSSCFLSRINVFFSAGHNQQLQAGGFAMFLYRIGLPK
jgi:hypothetical protein